MPSLGREKRRLARHVLRPSRFRPDAIVVALAVACRRAVRCRRCRCRYPRSPCAGMSWLARDEKRWTARVHCVTSAQLIVSAASCRPTSKDGDSQARLPRRSRPVESTDGPSRRTERRMMEIRKRVKKDIPLSVDAYGDAAWLAECPFGGLRPCMVPFATAGACPLSLAPLFPISQKLTEISRRELFPERHLGRLGFLWKLARAQVVLLSGGKGERRSRVRQQNRKSCSLARRKKGRASFVLCRDQGVRNRIGAKWREREIPLLARLLAAVLVDGSGRKALSMRCLSGAVSWRGWRG